MFLLTVNSAKLSLVGSVEDLLVEDLGLPVLALLEVTRGEIVLGFCYIRIVWTEALLVDLQGTLVIAFYFLIFALDIKSSIFNKEISL